MLGPVPFHPHFRVCLFMFPPQNCWDFYGSCVKPTDQPRLVDSFFGGAF